MKGKNDAKTHEEYIARVEEKRRPDISRLHDLVSCLEISMCLSWNQRGSWPGATRQS